jgi:hypothetical protein
MKKVLIALALLLAAGPVLAQNAGSFTLATRANADGTLTPTLTWSTTPAAASCTASGDAAWTGSKAASGTVTLANFPTTTAKFYALVCNWPGDTQALLTWTPPTQFEPYDHDGNPSTPNVTENMPRCASATDTGACLAGYRVNWGASATALSQAANVANPNATGFTVTNLTPGQWFFGVKAFTGQGAESRLSNVGSKTINAAVQWSQSTGVRVPQAPVMQ